MSATDLARALVAGLVAAGLRDVVVCPGSRSAPLAYAVADAEAAGWLRAHVRADERTAGFYALGLAKAAALRGTPRPVAVVVTSGTAVANLHPAVLEAAHGGVALLVLSADRPHAWRGTGANQTTTQTGLFGAAARAAVELPAGTDPAAVRGLAARAVTAALGTLTRDPGPVHVNVGFAEPLVPPGPWLPGDPPPPLPVVAPVASAPELALPAGRRTLAVAGDGAGPDAARLAAAAGWPLLAEPSSGARLPGALTHPVSVLADATADGRAARAERIVVFGHPTLSRPVSALLARRDVEIVVVSPTARWTDVAGTAAVVTPALEVSPPTPSDTAWLREWQEADAATARAFVPGPRERAARALWDAPGWLVLGSSTTVRAFDRCVPGAQRATRVVANRGLAGIDGLVSTAHGLAAGLGEPVRLVLGDLSFQHDVGGLVRGDTEPEADLQVVVLNDHGGSIFAGLEHGAAEPELFRRFFTTPQAFDVVAAARACGAAASRITVAAMADRLAEPVRGRTVLDVGLA
ncbi:2-succinyl-5-enolpyruvyl-6-hydroxy-3-cyclohexene-1-carboxylic-acid synthase [Propioniciclava soli]|uniref:2-succinyl-5-enolpyruvyl-6-hydroxy-3- cyclohexene-1-carboxylic-acid synthase n=1 Tax=Propioniciclava soli TaxID=2775081 RepID=UPI001E515CC7